MHPIRGERGGGGGGGGRGIQQIPLAYFGNANESYISDYRKLFFEHV